MILARLVGGGLCAALVLCGSARGEPVELDSAAVVGRLQDWLDGTRELEGRFEQTLASGALGTGLEESGRIYLRRPGKMRWDYLEPERKVALVEGQATRLYLEEDRQLWEGRLEDSGLLAALLAGSEPVSAVFETRLLAGPRESEDGTYRLQLVPRSEAESFREVTLTLREPEFAIRLAEVQDGAGNRMLYRFSGLRRNQGLPEGVFHFEAPPGTEVLRP
jgi:outer membrane lipoprotein carrier protein